MHACSRAGEGFFEDEALLNLGSVKEPPTDCVQRRMNGIAQLKGKEPLGAFVESVIVWLSDTNAIVIAEFDQPPVLDREAQEPVE